MIFTKETISDDTAKSFVSDITFDHCINDSSPGKREYLWGDRNC